MRANHIEFIFKLADQLLKDILDGDDADGGAELIYHHGEMAAAVFEFVEEIGQRLGFGDDQDIAHDVADGQGRRRGQRLGRGLRALETELHPAHQVLGVEHADDGFGTAGGIVNRDAGVLLLDDFGDGFLERHVAGKRKNVRARHHDFAGGDGFQIEGVVEQFLLHSG